MARWSEPEKSSDVSAPEDDDVRTRMRRYEYEEFLRARMSRDDQLEDVTRQALANRAAYYGPGCADERRLKKWEAAHPDWPIFRGMEVPDDFKGDLW